MADFLIVMAVTDPEAHKYQRASMLIVPTDAPGVDILRDIPTMEHPYEHYGRYGGHYDKQRLVLFVSSVTAVLATIGGFLQIPGVTDAVHHFLEPTFADSELYEEINPSVTEEWIGVGADNALTRRCPSRA